VSAAALASLFAVGLLGGVHCLGMCGGIVAALSAPLPGHGPRPGLLLSHHAGRLSTYAALGASAGGLGSALMLLEPLVPIQAVFYLLAQLMLVALGLYLLGLGKYLQPFEHAGRGLWRRLQPLGSRLLPVRTVPRAYAVGLLWGMLPCGLVYGVLAMALVAGSAQGGALAMLAFGLGTLPCLLAAGAVLPALQAFRRSHWVRRAAGAVVIGFGLFGLVHAAEVAQRSIGALLCAAALH
jgi:sulfite exporter TauE/SafE